MTFRLCNLYIILWGVRAMFQMDRTLGCFWRCSVSYFLCFGMMSESENQHQSAGFWLIADEILTAWCHDPDGTLTPLWWVMPLFINQKKGASEISLHAFSELHSLCPRSVFSLAITLKHLQTNNNKLILVRKTVKVCELNDEISLIISIHFYNSLLFCLLSICLHYLLFVMEKYLLVLVVTVQ